MQLGLLALVSAFGVVTLPGFGSWMSIKSILILSALVGMAALGQSIVVLIGGIDLGVAGYIVAGALMVTQFATLEQRALRRGPPDGHGRRGSARRSRRIPLPPVQDPLIIVTFAMGSVALGLAQLQVAGAYGGGAPAWLTQMTSPVMGTLGLPIPPLVLGGCRHRPGGAVPAPDRGRRRLLATGAIWAAELVHIRTRRVWVLAFAFSAVASVVAGVFLAGFAGNVDVTMGNPYLFESLAAVIIGGTVFGGPGDYTRTAAGAAADRADHRPRGTGPDRGGQADPLRADHPGRHGRRRPGAPAP